MYITSQSTLLSSLLFNTNAVESKKDRIGERKMTYTYIYMCEKKKERKKRKTVAAGTYLVTVT